MCSSVHTGLSAHPDALYNSVLRLVILIGQSGVQLKEQSPAADLKLRARLPCMTRGPSSNQSYLQQISNVKKSFENVF